MVTLPKAVLFGTVIIKERTTKQEGEKQQRGDGVQGTGEQRAEGTRRGERKAEEKGESQTSPAPPGSTEADPRFSAC